MKHCLVRPEAQKMAKTAGNSLSPDLWPARLLSTPQNTPSMAWSLPTYRLGIG